MNVLISFLTSIVVISASALGFSYFPVKTIGDNGLRIIKHYEGLRLKAYQDSVGVWTIGYGHIRGVRKGQVITEYQASVYLRKDVENAERGVNRYVKVWINQYQFDALVSWTFNLGSGALRTSTMLERLNEKIFDKVPCEMIRWTRAGGRVLRGLVKRRNSEARLFHGGSFSC